jgi:hypothetical protein
MVAYFIRRSGDDCAVIKLHSNDREEVVQDGLTLIAAEILCVSLIEDIPKPAAAEAPEAELPLATNHLRKNRTRGTATEVQVLT